MAQDGGDVSHFFLYDPSCGPPTASPPLIPGPDGEPVFEIALVLNGAVSAGAYTGGVLDYLTEALDAFDAAKAVERARHGDNYHLWEVPHHHVRLRVISGASAGGMSGAMLAAAYDRDFPHVHAAIEGETHGPRNPFYEPWVRQVDISGLLATHDLPKRATVVHSLLDCTVLTQICQDTLNFPARSGIGVRAGRTWLDGGLRLCLTVTNLRGVPYQLAFPGGGEVSFAMTRHADCQRFALGPAKSFVETAARLGEDVTPFRPRRDEFALPQVSTSNNPASAAMGTAALATASIPVALAARQIVPPADFAQSWYVTSDKPINDPTQNPTGNLVLPQAWTASVSPVWDAPQTYASGDGGMIDNAPLELARIELAGILGHNQREAVLAQRALVMINPFPAPPDVSDFKDPGGIGIFKVAARMLGVYMEQARFDPDDIRLAIDDDTYSRFMIHPRRTDSNGAVIAFGGAALACGAMGAFSGFLSEAYRRHDFLLGRMNCQGFLRDWFCLPVRVGEQIPRLFEGQNASLPGDSLPDKDGDVMRPIIPVLGVPETLQDPWPVAHPPDFDKLKGEIRVRVRTVLLPLAGSVPGLLGWVLRRWLVRAWVARVAAKGILKWTRAELTAWKLLGVAAAPSAGAAPVASSAEPTSHDR